MGGRGQKFSDEKLELCLCLSLYSCVSVCMHMLEKCIQRQVYAFTCAVCKQDSHCLAPQHLSEMQADFKQGWQNAFFAGGQTNLLLLPLVDYPFVCPSVEVQSYAFHLPPIRSLKIVCAWTCEMRLQATSSPPAVNSTT